MTPEQIEPIIAQERQEAEAEINKEKAAFYNAIYEGEQLPSNFMDLFKSSLFHMAPLTDNLSSKGLEFWVKKPIAELNFGEVMKMTEIIALAPRNKLFSSLEESFEGLHTVEMIMKDVRQRNALFEDEINKKKNELNQKLNKRKYELQNTSGRNRPQKEKKKNKMQAV